METLLTEIEAFCRAHDLTDSQFGRAALKDTRFVADLRKGRDIRLGTAEKVRTFMLTYRPAPDRKAA